MSDLSSPSPGLAPRIRAVLRELSAQPSMLAIVAEGFLTRLGFGMIGFALPLYAVSLGVDITEVGLLYALRTIVMLATKPMMGWVADRVGRTRVLIGAVLLRCCIGALFMLAVLPWQLFAIRALQGAMTAAREPSAMALLADHSDKGRVATVFAWYQTARDLGRSLGFGIAGLIIAVAGFQWVFLFAFVCSCAALLTVVRFVRDPVQPPSGAGPATAAAAPEAPPSGLRRALFKYASFGLMVALTAEMMRGLYPVIAVEYGHLTVAQTGIAASAASLAILFAGPVFGWLSDRGHRNLVLSIRSLANAGSSLIYILMPSFVGFLCGRVLDDTGKAAFRPAWGSMLSELSGHDRANRARMMALLDSTADIGEILGPLIAGLLIASFGIPAMLAVRIILSFVTELQAALIFRPTRHDG